MQIKSTNPTFHLTSNKFILMNTTRLKISGVASQFATQISGIAIQIPHLICNLLHKITPKLIKYVKNCIQNNFFRLCVIVKNFENRYTSKKLFWALYYMYCIIPRNLIYSFIGNCHFRTNLVFVESCQMVLDAKSRSIQVPIHKIDIFLELANYIQLSLAFRNLDYLSWPSEW
jgi:hypothetical protein